MRRLILALVLLAATSLAAQTPSRQPDWAKVDEETMRHFQAMLRMDTTDPPGGEKPVVDYLKQLLEAEGIPVQILAMPDQANRPNLVARIKGSGKLTAAAAHGPHRHGERGPEEMDASAVRRHP